MKNLISSGRLRLIVIDGLDGSGKGSVVKALTQKLQKEHVVTIDFPQYQKRWGKLLTFLLKVDDMDLTLEEKMMVYAINRVEIVDDVLNKIYEIGNSDKNPITMIFDRFWISSLVSIAYYLSKGELVNSSAESIRDGVDLLLQRLKSEDPEIIKVMDALTRINVSESLGLIKEIDSGFIEGLSLQNAKIVIPQINPYESVKRIQNDNEREDIKTKSGVQKTDLYETTRVQYLSYYLYYMAAKVDSKVVIVEQNGRTPQEIAEDVLAQNPRIEDFNIDSNEEVIHIEINQPDSILSKETQAYMDRAFNKYPRLKTLEAEIEERKQILN